MRPSDAVMVSRHGRRSLNAALVPLGRLRELPTVGSIVCPLAYPRIRGQLAKGGMASTDSSTQGHLHSPGEENLPSK